MNWEQSASAHAAVPARAVWRTLLDGRRWAEWHSGIEWMVVEDELAPGRHLTMKPKGAPQTAFTIEEVVPERALGLRLTFGPVATLRFRWMLEPAGDATVIRQTVSIAGPAAGVLLRKRAESIAAAMPGNLERLAIRSAAPRT